MSIAQTSLHGGLFAPDEARRETAGNARALRRRYTELCSEQAVLLLFLQTVNPFTDVGKLADALVRLEAIARILATFPDSVTRIH